MHDSKKEGNFLLNCFWSLDLQDKACSDYSKKIYSGYAVFGTWLTFFADFFLFYYFYVVYCQTKLFCALFHIPVGVFQDKRSSSSHKSKSKQPGPPESVPDSGSVVANDIVAANTAVNTGACLALWPLFLAPHPLSHVLQNSDGYHFGAIWGVRIRGGGGIFCDWSQAT